MKRNEKARKYTMTEGRELPCRRCAVHAGSYPSQAHTCISASVAATVVGWTPGHETCRMETIAEDAESEYELGNCVVQIGVIV